MTNVEIFYECGISKHFLNRVFVYGAYDELVLCRTWPQWTQCPQWTQWSLVGRVTFPTLAASLPPAAPAPPPSPRPLMLRSLVALANTKVCACNNIDKSLLTSSQYHFIMKRDCLSSVHSIVSGAH